MVHSACTPSRLTVLEFLVVKRKIAFSVACCASTNCMLLLSKAPALQTKKQRITAWWHARVQPPQLYFVGPVQALSCLCGGHQAQHFSIFWAAWGSFAHKHVSVRDSRKRNAKSSAIHAVLEKKISHPPLLQLYDCIWSGCLIFLCRKLLHLEDFS